MIAKNCAFTICSRNYLTLARVLRKSIEKYSSNCDFFICIADEVDGAYKLDKTELICKDVLPFSEEDWVKTSFKYDVTEFCTFLKPFCFDYFQSKYSHVCYFDPDILFFDSIDIIFKEFDDCEFLLTPHISDINNSNTDHEKIEDELRGSGIFNFGFLGLKTTERTKNFIQWWKSRLYEKCYRDSVNYLYTDQIWGNYLLTYFDLKTIKIQKALGWNIAPWNYSERKIILEDNKFKVVNRFFPNEKYSVVFVHYSGYDYESLSNKNIIQNNKGHESAYCDISMLFEVYSKELSQNIEELSSLLRLNYSYNYYSNGRKIHLFHRRLFRMFLLERKDIGNPFDSENPHFYKKIYKYGLFQKNCMVNNKEEVRSSGKKIKIVNYFFRIVFFVLGFEKYISLLKLLKAYGQFENQVHLIDKKNNVLWYREFIIR